MGESYIPLDMKGGNLHASSGMVRICTLLRSTVLECLKEMLDGRHTHEVGRHGHD